VKLVPGPVDKDQYGQLIRYVFSGNTFVNYTLVREGLASVDTSVDSSSFEACLGEFTSAQLGAQVELLGMWQNAAIGGVVSPSPLPATATPIPQLSPNQPALQTTASAQTTLTPATQTPQGTQQRPTQETTQSTPRPRSTPTSIIAPGDAEIYIVDVFVEGNPDTNESDEYIEIFNLSGRAVDLIGWRLNAGAEGEDFTFPNYILDDLESCRVYTNETDPDECSFSFGSAVELLNNEGDCVYLYTPSGEEFDIYCYGEQE
jgi:hypothetical protein